MQISKAFKVLIRACVDDERTLHHECGFVDDSRRVVLSRLAAERTRFAEQLRRLAGTEGADSTGSWRELMRELRRSIRVVAGGPNSSDAVSACRRSRERTEAVYDRVLGLPWPKQTLSTLREQRDRIREERRELIGIQF